jgi:hypothetical protein
MACMILALLTVLSAVEVSDHAPPPSRGYTGGSVSLIGSASLGASLFGASQNGSAFQAMTLQGSVAVRVVTKVGFTIEPRVGADGIFTLGSAGLYGLLAPRGGLGLGWAFALNDRLALTPMLAYEATYIYGGFVAPGVSQTGVIELPLTVFFSRNAFVEVFARGGAVSMFGGLAPTFSAGYRFGMVW